MALYTLQQSITQCWVICNNVYHIQSMLISTYLFRFNQQCKGIYICAMYKKQLQVMMMLYIAVSIGSYYAKACVSCDWVVHT